MARLLFATVSLLLFSLPLLAFPAPCVLLQGSTTTEITEITLAGSKTYARPLHFDFMNLGKESKQMLERRGFAVIEKSDRRAYGNLPLPRYEMNFSVRCELKEFPALFGGTRLVNLCNVQGDIQFLFQDGDDTLPTAHVISTMVDERLQITDTKALNDELEKIPLALLKNLPKSVCR